jgi:hypothetical protein
MWNSLEMIDAMAAVVFSVGAVMFVAYMMGY